MTKEQRAEWQKYWIEFLNDHGSGGDWDGIYLSARAHADRKMPEVKAEREANGDKWPQVT